MNEANLLCIAADKTENIWLKAGVIEC